MAKTQTDRTDGEARVLEFADVLAEALKATPVVQEFTATERLFRTDPGLQAMMKTLRQKAEEFQHAEQSGSLDEKQLHEFREMQARFQAQPLLRNFQDARAAAEGLLVEANSIISQILGVDFGRAAGPITGGC